MPQTREHVAACELLGVGPGYATGKSLTALVDPSVRAALRSQLAAAARTGIGTRLGCGMLADTGLVRCQLEIRPLSVRGDADRLLVAVTPDQIPHRRDASGPDADPASTDPASTDPADAAAADAAAADDAAISAVQRLDLLAAAARQLLETLNDTTAMRVTLQKPLTAPVPQARAQQARAPGARDQRTGAVQRAPRPPLPCSTGCAAGGPRSSADVPSCRSWTTESGRWHDEPLPPGLGAGGIPGGPPVTPVTHRRRPEGKAPG